MSFPTKPKFMPGDRVTHVLRPQIQGLVTVAAFGFNGWTYRVTWASDKDDETHYVQELVPETDPDAPVFVGFQSPPQP
jgi:hypothetical protein